MFSPKNHLNMKHRSPIPEDPNEHQIPIPFEEIVNKNKENKKKIIIEKLNKEKK